jgi:hypothetical protein
VAAVSLWGPNVGTQGIAAKSQMTMLKQRSRVHIPSIRNEDRRPCFHHQQKPSECHGTKVRSKWGILHHLSKQDLRDLSKSLRFDGSVQGMR